MGISELQSNVKSLQRQYYMTLLQHWYLRSNLKAPLIGLKQAGLELPKIKEWDGSIEVSRTM